MNAPFIVAQAVTTGQATTPQPTIVKLTKPANGQAVSLTLDANTQLDFSGIANDQITLVRVGNQIVILFDNQATITAGPFFDGSGNPLDGIHIDLGNNRIVDGQEFAGLFPISNDTNILPASGGAGGDGFGAGDPHVDPLGVGNPLDLLGDENSNSTFSINDILGLNNNNNVTGPIEPAPTAFSQTIGIDEDGNAPFQLIGSVAGGPGDSNDPVKYFGGPNAPTPSTPLFSFGPDGPAAVNPIVFDTAALDALLLTSFGQPVTWTQTGDVLTGRAGGESIVIELRVLDLQTGDFSVEIFRPLDHPAPAGGVADENEINIPIGFTLTDGNGTTAGGTLTVGVDDDSPDPCNPFPGEVEETGASVQATVDLDLEWGADYYNGNNGPIDRSIAFANNTTPGANVAVSDVNGNPLPALTSNGDPILYTIIPPAVQGGLVYLVAYTDPKSVPTSQNGPGVVFWVSLSDQALGIAVFELRGVIDHAAAPMFGTNLDGTTGYIHAADLTFSFNAFDSDGDGVTGTFTIRVDAAGDVYVCGCGFVTIDYSALTGGVFINLDDRAHTEFGQTVDGDTATDFKNASPKVIGLDNVAGVEHAIGTDKRDLIIGGDEGNTLEGLGGNDLIRGGRGADIIYGDAGQDTIYGGRGDDAIQGGDGADTIYGGRGWDEIHGGAGNDWISGGADSDFLTGDGGDDTIRGGAGADLIWGGAGEDDIRGGRGADEIYGDGGNDTIRGGRGADYIEGNGGDDNIRGGRGNDEIYGGAGNDTIRGGKDDDYIEGNGGDDRFIYNVGDGHDLVLGGAGDDTQEIYGTADSETFNVNAINIAGDLYVGINIRDGISPFDVVPATPGNAEVATRGVEDIYIDTGAGPDNVFVLGSLGGTGLATSTITIEGGPDNSIDIVDASLLTSNHSITFYGRGGDDAFALNTGKGTDTFDGGSGIDTAYFSCNVADATIAFDGTHWTVTVNGSTDTMIGVEGITFLDQEYLLVDHAGTDVGGFQTIQDAVDYTCGCQTILIAPGTYNEDVTIDGKDATLSGLNPTRDTIITGQITVTGVLDGDVTISNLTINAAGENYGVFANASSTGFAGEINLDNVLVENAANNGFAYNRAGNGGVPTLADTIGAISIVGSEFTGNGGAAGNTRGDILIYGFNGDLTIADTSIHDPAAGADKAIQVRGIQDGSDQTNIGPFASFGDVSITDLTITGTYSQDLVAFYRIADFASFVATNVTLNANAPWGLFNLDEVGGTVDLSGVTGANAGGPFIATMQGLASGEVFTGTDGNDMFVGRGGDDNLSGGGGNDTFFYTAGGGRDIVDGGTETTRDLLDVTGTSATENFFIEIPADYNARALGPDYAGSAEILVSNGEQILVEAKEIEDIVIHGGGGADTLTVSGSFTGTSLLTSTITYDSGTGDDKLDLTQRDSNHRVVADGGTGTDTVIYDFARSSATVTKIFDTDGVTVIGANITHSEGGQPVTDVLKNFESFQFSDRTYDLTDVFNLPPNAVDDFLFNKTEDTPFTVAIAVLLSNDTDPENDPRSFVSVQGAVGGTVGVSGGSIAFTPDANYFGPASFTYTIRDSLGGEDTATVNFDLIPVNDPPSLDLDADDSTIGAGASFKTFTIGGPAIQVTDSDVLITDPDSTVLLTMVVTLTNAQAGDALALPSVPAGWSTVILNPTTIYLTGFGSHAFTADLIESVTFTTTSTSTVQRSIAVTVTDDSGAGSGSTALIAINNPTTILSADNGDVTEDAGSNPTGPNLVFNGGFDSYSLVAGSPVIGHIATLPGWTLQGTSFQADFDDFVSSTASLQINGLSNVSQNITTLAGQRYQLSFWHDGPTTQTTQASFNGNLLISATPPATNSPFLLYTVEFDGTGGPATLRFTQPGFGSSNLDNVSVQLLAPSAQQTDSGAILFTDADSGDTHSASFAAQGAGYLGTFSLGAVDQGANSVGWTYVADNSALQVLRGGETRVQTYAVTISDGHGGADTENVTVTLHGVNDAPVITSNNGDPLAVSAAENQTAVAAIIASDVDLGDTLIWTLSGADAGLFNISNTGVLTFKTAPSFEAPVGGDNIYNVTAQVSDGTLTDTQAVTVTVTNANDAPVLDLDADDSSGAPVAGDNVIVFPAGQTDAQVLIADSVVIDPDSTSFTATLTLFQVEPSDQLDAIGTGGTATISGSAPAGQVIMTITANSVAGLQSMLDGVIFTNHSASPTSGPRTITVVVNDGVNDSNIATVNVVMDVPPVISAVDAIKINENTTAVTTVSVSDPDGPALSYSLSGDDAALFQITAAGVLSFVSAPNFEAPADTGGNNIYDVVVTASDGLLTDTHAIAVTVQDRNDAPVITSDGGGSSATVTVNENTTAVTDVDATDEDGSTPSYVIAGGADASLFQIDLSTGLLSFINAPDFEARADSDGNNRYEVTVRAFDGLLTDDQAITVVVNNINDAPVITGPNGGDPATFKISENTNNVAVITATDPEGVVPSYTIVGGADAGLFEVGPTPGNLRFATAPVFVLGGDNTYEVVVQASDGFLTDTQAITVNVLPANVITYGLGSTPGSSIATATDLTNRTYLQSFDPEVENATTNPSITINASESPGNTHFYSLVIAQNDTLVVFDLDQPFGFNFDTVMRLFNSTGLNIIAVNDDRGVTDPGSNNFVDPFLSLTLDAGTYYLQVGELNNTTGTIGAFTGLGFSYDLQVSVVAPGTVDPIVFDLNGDGFQFGATTQFDMNHDGHAETMRWMNGGDGLLVADLNHSGAIESGREVFSPGFDGGHYADSVAALRSYDSNGDGVVDAQDARFGELQIWADANGNGITDAGELKGLADSGIAAINLDTAAGSTIDGQHVFAAGSFTTTGGDTGQYVGVELTELHLPDAIAELAGKTRVGTDGADTFALSGQGKTDTILDYSAAQGDTLDLSKLLDASFAQGTSNVSDFVKLTGSGSDVTVQVDADGAGSNAGWESVAVLSNYNSAGNQVLVNIEHQTQQLQVA